MKKNGIVNITKKNKIANKILSNMIILYLHKSYSQINNEEK